MSVRNFAEALSILEKYNPDGYTAAEHDEFFAGGVPPKEMSTSDAARLSGLYWRWNVDNECWGCYT